MCQFLYTRLLLCCTYNENKGLIEEGQCPYNCARYISNRLIDFIYQPMPSNMSEWNDYMCNDFKRSGTLCGACSADHNLYPRSYAYLPLTLFCLIIYLFKIDIHSSPIQGFIIFSQILTIPAHIRATLLAFRNRPKMLQVIKVLATFFGIWNLDFF